MTSAEEDQDIKGCHTCPLRRGWTNWAVAAWRGHGFGMGLTASFNACRDITKKVKPDFSQGWTAGGWESRQELKLNKFRLDIRISFFPMKRVRHWKRLPKGVFGKSTSHRLVQLQVPQMVWNLMSYSGSASPSYQSLPLFFNLDDVAAALSGEDKGKKSQWVPHPSPYPR